MSKNNPQKRGKAAAGRVVEGKEVKPVFYFGKHKGHGNYIAAAFDNGNLAMDAQGRPLPYQNASRG
ncbi:MAG: hypothetical protein IT567_01825 [Alphaproteobacteria bacterium]|nr:hypothetical protein [Alphaproteobacteria bacterium]